MCYSQGSNIIQTVLICHRHLFYGGDDVVENTRSISFPDFKQAINANDDVFGLPEQKFLVVISAAHVPNIAGRNPVLGARHDAFSIKPRFDP